MSNIALYIISALSAAFALIAAGLAAAAYIKFSKKSGADLGGYIVAETEKKLQQAAQQIITNVGITTSSHLGVANVGIEGKLNTVMQQSEAAAQRTEGKVERLTEATEIKLTALADRLDQKFEKFKDETVRQLTESRKAYEEQLQKIRETVDEKLTSTIEQRFKNSFTLISGRLEEINKGFQELQVLQSKVGDLNRIFSNVKTSGTWGEVSLENLLSQILTPDQFERQVNLTRGSDSDENRVDFAVKLPGKESGTVKLPIDAKFPSERYFQLIDAAERGSLSEVEATRRDFFDAVKKMARDISQRYIKIGKTTDFAIMYLPVEGMFAEVAKEAGLLEKLQNDYRVVVTGPTTLAALLNSLQMGFRTLAIEKRSAEIQSLFDHFKRDFATFSELLAKTQKKLSEISNTIEQADKRTKIIGKALDKVSAIPLPKAALELAEDSEVAAEMPEWDIETEDETA